MKPEGKVRLFIRQLMFVSLALCSSFTLAAELQPCTKAELPLTTEDQIIEALICELGGKVLKLEPLDQPPGHYQARMVLDNGHVKTLTVDGATGIVKP